MTSTGKASGRGVVTKKTSQVTPISSDLINNAKQLISTWFDTAQPQSNIRGKLLGGIEIIARELPKRTDWYEVLSVSLDKSEDIEIEIRRRRCIAITCKDRIVVSSVVPGWGFGWKTILKNKEVYDILSWLMHYSRQYIHRANVVSALMVIWDKYQRPLHPFGSAGNFRRYGALQTAPSIRSMLAVEEEEALQQWGSPKTSRLGKTQSIWTTANFLDSHLHQAAFHFLRGQTLRQSDFYIEAVIAFDCALQAVGSFLHDNGHLSSTPSRAEICKFFSFSKDAEDLAEYGYFLRNNFGAHAGGWRWWDQNDMIDDYTIESLSDFVRGNMIALVGFERAHRSIESQPKSWPVWYFENFRHIWNSVWFEKYAKWAA